MTREDKDRITRLRDQIDEANARILKMLNDRAALTEKVREYKVAHGLALFDPVREARQMEGLLLKNRGPMSARGVEMIFKEIFRASLSQMETATEEQLLVKVRGKRPLGVDVGGVTIGGGTPVIIAGPCAVEHQDSLDQVAGILKELGVKLIRGGAFKPRTSPYTFQGFGMEGIKMLSAAAKPNDLKVVTELTDLSVLDEFIKHVDMVQVGARNMFNYDMLKRLGDLRHPVLLKRSFAASLDELLLAAEYLLAGGNDRVVLCERGIRTFETATRNTLDLSAVCLIKELTDLPVIVDVSHAAGRKDILAPLARAALAAGADGIMVEFHPHPEGALSDGSQQLNIEEFKQLMDDLGPCLEC